MWVYNHRKVFYVISGIIFAASIAMLSVWGLKPSIEFTGGSIIETRYDGAVPTQAELEASLTEAGFTGFSIRPAGDASYIVRTKPLSETERQAITEALSREGSEVERFNSVGATLGAELISKATVSVILVVLAIILYVAFAFRHVSKPVSSWTYGLITVVTLVHDVLVPLGVFAALGYFGGIEVDSLFITAMLVVLGYSINDTIVVFDRIRENLNKAKEAKKDEDFKELVGRSLRETIVRSFNTSATTLIALTVLFFVGSTATQYFALALGVGVLAGTYSSIFIAAPLLVDIAAGRGKTNVL